MVVCVEIEHFGSITKTYDDCDGKEEVVKKFILKTDYMQVELTNYGASLIGLKCPDKHGSQDDILLGFDSLDGYVKNKYFGSTVGRSANRIYKGKFTLDNVTYQLACNNGPNHLHGGNIGFDSKVWDWKEVENGVEFTLLSRDGDEGYPGTLLVIVAYIIKEANELTISMRAQCTDGKPTIVNLTNHAFINLAGQHGGPSCNIYDHVLNINAETYLPHLDAIPTGDIAHVAGSSFDFFTAPKEMGQDLQNVDGGYDHNYCLRNDNNHACVITHPATGRVLRISTSQPGVQFYSGNFLDTRGKGGNVYKKHSGFCLEPQEYPDNVNHNHFPSSVLQANHVYEQFITWKLNTTSGVF